MTISNKSASAGASAPAHSALRTPHSALGNGHPSEKEQTAYMLRLRKEAAARCEAIYATAASPIRTMARMVREIETEARKAGISPEVIARMVVDRTIGDVNVRKITEKRDGVDYT